MRNYNSFIVNQFDTLSDGNSGANLPVTVRIPATGVKANLYDETGAEIDNPVLSGPMGNYSFYIDQGTYNIIINEGMASEYTVKNQPILEGGNGSGSITCKDLNNLIYGTSINGIVDFPSLASSNGLVNTIVNNDISGTGGGFYRINTLAQERVDRDDPLWEPDGGISLPISYNGNDYLGGIVVGANHYVGGGTDYVAILELNGGQPWDAQFGTVGTDKDPSGIYDDYLALSKFFTYCRTNRDGGDTGGLMPYISPRSTFWISETIDLLNFFAPVNWNGADLFPISPITLINYEAVGSEMSSLFIRHSHLPVEEVYNAKKAAITYSGGQPSNVNSETVFNNLNRVLIYNPYRGIQLDSFDDNNGGLIWQSAFDECTVWNALDWGFYFFSVEQVSTTTSFRSCHAKNVDQDNVQHNGLVYFAIQHMPSSSPIEPGVTTDWEDYWRVKESSNGVPTIPTTQPQWETATFYRTNGKGYYINNVQTCAFYNCSADGSNNWESGCIMYALNSVVTIDAFHLEGARMVRPDSLFFDMNCDLNFGTLYMYDLQMNLPGSADRAPLIGGTLGRSRVGELLNVRNHTQNAVRKGQFDIVRLYSNGQKDFGRFHTGVSINSDLVTGKEFAAVYTSDQDTIDYRQPDNTFIMNNPASYFKIYETTIPDAGEPQPTYVEFNDIVEVTANSGNNNPDPTGRSARFRVSVFVQSGAAPDKSFFDIEQVDGNGDFIYSTFNTTTRLLELFVKCSAAGQTAMSKLYGRNSGFESGVPYKDGSVSRLLDSPVEVAGTTVEAQEGFAALKVKLAYPAVFMSGVATISASGTGYSLDSSYGSYNVGEVRREVTGELLIKAKDEDDNIGFPLLSEVRGISSSTKKYTWACRLLSSGNSILVQAYDATTGAVVDINSLTTAQYISFCIMK